MRKKKNLAILTHSMLPGGAEKVISLLISRFIEDYEVTLILFLNSIHFDLPDQVRLVTLRNKSRLNLFEKTFGMVLFQKEISNYLSKHPHDILISFLTKPNLIAGSLKAKFPNMKIIISERGFPSFVYGRSIAFKTIMKPLIRKFYNNADFLFSNSLNINLDLEKNFEIKIPLHVIYNPVDLQKQKIISYETKKISVVTVGSINFIKNQKLLLKSLLFSPDIFDVAIIGGIGDHYGPNTKEELMSFIEENKLHDKVKLLGIKKNIPNELYKYDVFVLTSISEGFPNALLEACACGIPVISTNCMTGPLEMLNENEPVSIKKGAFVLAKYGLLINVGDELGLSNAINYLNDFPSERVKYGNRAYIRAQEYSLEKIYNNLESLLS